MKKILSLLLITGFLLGFFPVMPVSGAVHPSRDYMAYGTFDEDGGPDVGPLNQTVNTTGFLGGWSAYEVWNVYDPQDPSSESPISVVDGPDNPFSIYEGDQVVKDNGKAMKISLYNNPAGTTKRSYLQYLNKSLPDAAEGTEYTGTRVFEMDFMLDGSYNGSTTNAFFYLLHGAIYCRVNSDGTTFSLGMYVGGDDPDTPGTVYKNIVNDLKKGQNYNIKYVYSLVDISSEDYVTGGYARSVAVYLDGEKIATGYEGYYTRSTNLNFMKDSRGNPNYGFVYSSAAQNAGFRMGFFGMAEGDLYGYLDNVKYYGVDELKVTDISPEDNTHDFPVDGEIKISFSKKPNEVQLNSDYIKLVKDGGQEVAYKDSYYDEDTNQFVIDFKNDNLDYNTSYTIEVSDTLVDEEIGLNIAEGASRTFATGFEKLIITNVLAVNSQGETILEPVSGTVNISLTAINNSLIEGEFKTITALYQRMGSVVNMVSHTENNQIIPKGETRQINVDSVVVPNDEKQYFIKVFFRDGEQDSGIAARAVLIGEDQGFVPQQDIETSTPLMITEIETLEDTGKISISGKYDGLPYRGISIKVTGPDGRIMYLDETNSGETGNFGFSFNLPEGSTNGTYICKITAATGETLSQDVEMDFSNVLPAAENLTISGMIACGEELMAEYDYFHFGSVAEGNSEIKWLISNTEDGEFTQIASGEKLFAKNEYLNKYIKFTVTVKTVDNVSGLERESSVARITASPKVANLSLRQSNNKINVTYDYSHLLGYEEYKSICKWYIGQSASGQFELIDNNTHFYNVSREDKDKYVKVEITPMALVPEGLQIEREGLPVMSSVVKINYSTTPGGPGGMGGTGGYGGGTVTGKPQANIYTAMPPQKDEAGAVDFLDVRGHWAEKYIFSLYDGKIVNGKSETFFGPDDNITRAEFVAILARALGIAEGEYAGEFADVLAGDWYAGYIKAVFDKGILQGSEGKAYPNSPITREEMAVLAIGAYEKLFAEIEIPGGILDFEDAEHISDWACEYVIKAKEIKFVSGMNDGSYHPASSATRAQACVVVLRMMSAAEEFKQVEDTEESSTEIIIETGNDDEQHEELYQGEDEESFEEEEEGQ